MPFFTTEPIGVHTADGMRQLYVRGNTDLLTAPRRAAFVGSRASTSYGQDVTRQLITSLPRDTVIVSGGAYGIDAAAHEAAMWSGLATIAVMARGLDKPYPMGHGVLFEKIVRNGGLLVSQYPDGAAPTRHTFLERNRTIAALSHALIVVEAGVRSGSLNAARHAKELGVPAGAVPGPITSPASAGTNLLIQQGARLVADPTDILNLITEGS